MTENVENLLLEHMKRMQAEMAVLRENHGETMGRLGHIETMIARLGRDSANSYEELIEDRHSVDGSRARIEQIKRIERRLEIGA